MLQQSLIGILIPFAGTTLGAGSVFFLRKNLGRNVQRALTGFAAGVMVAASIWSLLIPALEQSEESGLGHFAFLPAVIGLWIGTLFLLLLDKLIPHLHLHAEKAEGRKSSISKTAMLLLAVTIHNIPEGMAVGIVFAGFLNGSAHISASAALALSLGIAIQNFPEGAIISMPLHAEGESRPRACVCGPTFRWACGGYGPGGIRPPAYWPGPPRKTRRPRCPRRMIPPATPSSTSMAAMISAICAPTAPATRCEGWPGGPSPAIRRECPRPANFPTAGKAVNWCSTGRSCRPGWMWKPACRA